MPKIVSKIDPSSELFRANRAHYESLLATLRERQAVVVRGNRDAQITRHLARGKLLARDRIDLVIDPHTPFLELSTLAGWGMHDGQAPGAGIVTGIGTVHGVPCMFIANDATVKGGSFFPETVKKHIRAQDIAAENRLPCIYLVDCGGAYLPLQDQVFPDKEHFGHTFYNQAKMSAMGLPQIAVVMGGCTAGGAYIPAMSDEVVIVKGEGQIFLGGPPIVKAAINEIVDAETLGGALVHTRQSGVADYLALSEPEAFATVRDIIAKLNWRTETYAAVQPVAEPLYDPEEITGIINADLRLPYDVREIIARLVDGSDFQEFKPLYATTLICGTATMWGYPVGILGNNGVLFSESAFKATHFIEMCNQRNIPLLFLQNITGYMVGTEAEARGIAKDGAKMVSAVACARVPRFTVLIGGSYGAGNYGMCGRGFEPRFLFTWPTARCATMSAETAVTVMVDIKKAGLSGDKVSEAELQDIAARTTAQYSEQSDPYYATARLWDDGLTEPVQTRDVLGLCLSLAATQPPSQAGFHVYRM